MTREGGGLCEAWAGPRVEVSEIVAPLVLQPSRSGGVGALHVPLDPVGRVVRSGL